MKHSRVVEIWRGPMVESVHYGSIAVTTSEGGLVASVGDVSSNAYMRSSAKPLQALPVVERGAAEAFGFEPAELAICCASHAGTDDHVETVRRLQAKIGVDEEDLKCGVHLPYDLNAQRNLIREGLHSQPLRNNCSGKHTGMLALARHLSLPQDDYLNMDHPVQVAILEAVQQMTGAEAEIGIDGCSAPNFAVPLQAAALAYARLIDPSNLSEPRANACKKIADAMRAHPVMVSGPGRFDTRVMEVSGGRILSKGGADGFQAMAIPKGNSNLPFALGVAIKIADGDLGKRALGPVSIAVLAAIGALSPQERSQLSEFDAGPSLNLRELNVGRKTVTFDMVMENGLE